MSTSPIPPVLDQDRYAVYQPTAATTDFALGFPLFGEASDVAVYLNGNLLTLATDYTVRSVTNGTSLTPAPVTDAYVRLNAPISAGTLEIFGNFRPRRTIQASAPYGTRDFNFAFSLLMAALREMWSKFTRAIKVPAGEIELTIPSSTDRAGQVLAFDAAGKPTIGGRYADLMASASAAGSAASTAISAAQAAAESAEAAALFDPTAYPTKDQITSLLQGFVPTSRKIKVGKGLLLGGTAGSDAAPVAKDLSNDLLLALDMGALSGLLKNVRLITTSGNIQPSAGATKWLGFLVGGANDGLANSGNGAGLGQPGGAGCAFFATVADTLSYSAIIGGKGGNSSLTIGSTTYSAQGAGGSASGGFLNLSGALGGDATVTNSNNGQTAIGGFGGDGPFGFGHGGGGGMVTNWTGFVTRNGINAVGYGAAGGSAAGLGGSGSGGSGTPGCLLLLEF